MRAGKLKVIPTIADYNHNRKAARWKLQGKCQGCGSKLKDPLSIARGYGAECFSKFVGVAVVLKFKPDEPK